MHYKSIPTLSPKQIESFWSKVDKTSSPDGCWLWHGTIEKQGYGVVKIRGAQLRVHRIAYLLSYGEMPDDLTIDHVRDRGCVHKNCVNPAHLEAVPMGINTLRADTVSGINKRKTVCVRGHDLVGENLGIHHGKTGTRRYCKACRQLVQRERQSTELGKSLQREYSKTYRDRHPESTKESADRYRAKRNAQESPAEYESRRGKERAWEAAYRERKRNANRGDS